MIRPLALLSALFIFSLNAEAVSSSAVGSFDCSESLSVSLIDTASFSCAGNFSLSSGSIISDTKISITSSGSLSLDNLLIIAPFVEFSSSSGHVSIGNGVLISTSSFLVTVGNDVTPTFEISPRASISVGNGETARIIGASEILQSINHGEITPLVGGNISITPSIPEPNTYISLLLGLLVVLALKNPPTETNMQ